MSFVVPIYYEQAVGDQTAYGHIVTLFSSVAWFLYAAPDYPDAIVSMGINTVSTLLQLVYVAVFLWFAVGVVRHHALYVFSPRLRRLNGHDQPRLHQGHLGLPVRCLRRRSYCLTRLLLRGH